MDHRAARPLSRANVQPRPQVLGFRGWQGGPTPKPRPPPRPVRGGWRDFLRSVQCGLQSAYLDNWAPPIAHRPKPQGPMSQPNPQGSKPCHWRGPFPPLGPLAGRDLPQSGGVKLRRGRVLHLAAIARHALHRAQVPAIGRDRPAHHRLRLGLSRIRRAEKHAAKSR